MSVVEETLATLRQITDILGEESFSMAMNTISSSLFAAPSRRILTPAERRDRRKAERLANKQSAAANHLDRQKKLLPVVVSV